jgi:type VI protein secretion system component Hcp
MSEHSDIYLLLYRQSGTYKMISANKLTAAMVLATLTKGMIIGDSMDAPFMGFIKCTNIDHEIGLGSSQKELEYGDSHLLPDDHLQSARKQAITRSNYDRYKAAHDDPANQAQQAQIQTAYDKVRKSIDKAYHKAVEEQRHAFINTHLPKHDEFTFTKMVDRSTPQLAFGCSAQERFPCALFFLRKKVGFGLGGIRIPHLVIGLRKVRISKWKMGEEKETVSLRYGDIAWAALGQVADSDIPMPIPTARLFSTEENAGGENFSSGWAYGMQAIAAAATLIAGGVVKGISASNGSYS